MSETLVYDDVGQSFVVLDQTQGPAGTVVGIVGNVFEYAPGGTAGGNVYTTEASLAAALSLATGPCWVMISTTYTTPATLTSSVWDLQGGEIMCSQWPVGGNTLQVQGTGYIKNCSRLVNMIVECDSTTTAAFQWGSFTTGSPVLVLDAASITYGGSASASPIQVPASGTLFVDTANGSDFFPNGNTTPFVALGTGATLSFQACEVGTSLQIPATLVSGAAGTSLLYSGDYGAFPLPTQTAFSGTITQAVFGVSPLQPFTSSGTISGGVEALALLEVTGAAMTLAMPPSPNPRDKVIVKVIGSAHVGSLSVAGSVQIEIPTAKGTYATGTAQAMPQLAGWAATYFWAPTIGSAGSWLLLSST